MPAVLLLLLAACGSKPALPPAAAQRSPPPNDLSRWPGLDQAPRVGPAAGWSTSARADHPLVGAIWSVRDRTFLSEAELLARARAAPTVLLGEKHDNPDHHALQARLVQALAGPGTPVVFEMLDEGDQPGIDAARTASDLAQAVGWSESGWPDFPIYAPLFDALFERGAQVWPGHPTRATLQRAMKQGLASLPADQLDDLRLERSDNPTVYSLYRTEILESHCGHAPEAIVPAMVLGQRLKDAWMARALRQAQRAHPDSRPLLIAGGGHLRPDRAVPLYLEGSFSLVWSEVPLGDGAVDPTSLEGAADAIWFTPRLDDLDPCEVFAEQLKSLGPARP